MHSHAAISWLLAAGRPHGLELGHKGAQAGAGLRRHHLGQVAGAKLLGGPPAPAAAGGGAPELVLRQGGSWCQVQPAVSECGSQQAAC
jgi:hypothetical protein